MFLINGMVELSGVEGRKENEMSCWMKWNNEWNGATEKDLSFFIIAVIEFHEWRQTCLVEWMKLANQWIFWF